MVDASQTTTILAAELTKAEDTYSNYLGICSKSRTTINASDIIDSLQDANVLEYNCTLLFENALLGGIDSFDY